ncbi:peptidoglycan-binding domain-containing protein [Hyphomicrobium sp.]|uniref:peptidoglycan-binding domain-containing protein n=1 Tax=Hyphomicrobium sp. TaxID=82 RepID=UPI000FC240CD|nr:peptidoglycan-binding domain-containing protein [Hyphomicrobium sp.]MBN9247083.1 peptidoglycan-binding protein [Hyphomicrobium sp.]RUP11128.1 MAG: peptidoglycan-binding protein [Hyphomicrobium sp.]
MTERDVKLAAVISLLATTSVALNMFVFQNTAPGSAIETGGIVTDRTSWVDGPGIALGPTSPGPAAPNPPAADGVLPPAPLSQIDDANRAELTKGIQRELGNLHYEPGQADGVLGTVTRAAIFAYEYDNGLVLTGQPSEQLLSQLILGSSSMSPSAARPGKTMTADGESLVRTVKQQLSALGYQTGVPGSAMTPEFARAVREFETDQKLKVTGRISGPLVSRITRLQGEPKARREAIAKAAKH